MTKILIGSKCLKYWFPFCREPHDIDFATINEKRTIIGSPIVEIKPIPALFDYLYHTVISEDYLIADIDMLYTLKCSHLSWNINFGKHAKDIMFLEEQGACLVPELYTKLYKYWEVIHTSKRHIKLNKPNEDFFNNGVNYLVEHDKLHEKHKFFDKPLYWECKTDKSKAILDKSIFDSWDEDKQLKLALEEILVIAEERFNSNAKKAVKHIITNLSKGWFNTFVITNLNKLIKEITH